jgi:hypothetical protein
MTVNEMFLEWRELKSEQINFMRAGIDDAMTDAMHRRDTYVYNRIKEMENELFPLLTDRKVLTFDNVPRVEYWEQCNKVIFSGYIIIDSTAVEKMFTKDNPVTGVVTFAKKPI